MFGAGSWEKQDKVLPGTYVNKTALKKADTKLSERGYAIAAREHTWEQRASVIKEEIEKLTKEE